MKWTEMMQTVKVGDVITLPPMLKCASSDSTDFKVTAVHKDKAKNGKVIGLDLRAFFLGIELGEYGLESLAVKGKEYLDFYELVLEEKGKGVKK